MPPGGCTRRRARESGVWQAFDKQVQATLERSIPRMYGSKIVAWIAPICRKFCTMTMVTMLQRWAALGAERCRRTALDEELRGELDAAALNAVAETQIVCGQRTLSVAAHAWCRCRGQSSPRAAVPRPRAHVQTFSASSGCEDSAGNDHEHYQLVNGRYGRAPRRRPPIRYESDPQGWQRSELG